MQRGAGVRTALPGDWDCTEEEPPLSTRDRCNAVWRASSSSSSSRCRDSQSTGSSSPDLPPDAALPELDIEGTGRGGDETGRGG